MLLIILATNMN